MMVEILFGEVCNLGGDGQNGVYLQQTLPEAEFVHTALTETPRFVTQRPDMILLGGMTERTQRRVVNALRPYRERLAELVDSGVVILATGNAGDVFLKEIDYVTEELREQGLGFFDLTAKTDLFHRYNGKFLGEVAGIPVVGFRSQFAFWYGDNSQCYFADNTRSIGINPETHLEGARRNNLICTQIQGPILPLNPLFTEYLIGLTGNTAQAAHREAAMAAYEQRLSEFRSPDVKF